MVDRLKELNLLTITFRGMRNKKKRDSTFKWIKRQKSDIIFIQEAYCMQIHGRKNGGGELFALCDSTNSKGLLTMISSQCQVKINDIIKKDNGSVTH